MRDQVSNFTFREALAGNIDVAGLPFAIASQIKALQRKLYRQHERRVKRETKAQEYAAFGLNGPRAVLRRQRQIAAGSLRVENGLVA